MERIDGAAISVPKEPSSLALATLVDGIALNARHTAIVEGAEPPRSVVLGSRLESGLSVSITALRSGGTEQRLTIAKDDWRAKGTGWVFDQAQAFVDGLEPK